MKSGSIIEEVTAREVLDSRGNPTVEACVKLSDGSVGYVISPSGASTGIYEALELRDNDKKRYMGKGVLNAVKNVNTVINDTLKGMESGDIYAIDAAMIKADGTKDKSKLGANAILAVSIAASHAAAASLKLPLYRLFGGIAADTMPVPMMNILNGGAHANNNVDIQEFMIVPVRPESYGEGVRMCAEIYTVLKSSLKKSGLFVGIGDEGGFAPDLNSDEDAIKYLCEAAESAGYSVNRDVKIALDVAASEWYKDGNYHLPKKNKTVSSDELIDMFCDWKKKYPIISIEDPLGEDDTEGWQKITKKMNDTILVGDDLFVTNVRRIKMGLEKHVANSVLIKLNQIGTLTETLAAINTAKKVGYKTIISHRSGDTPDDFIADLAVALNADFIKAGAPARGERVAKYNRLLEIEKEISSSAFKF